MELRLQDAVLLVRVLDDLVLLALDSTDERSDEQLQRNRAPSLRQPPATGQGVAAVLAKDRRFKYELVVLVGDNLCGSECDSNHGTDAHYSHRIGCAELLGDINLELSRLS